MINNIRMERLKAGLTQEILADRLNVSRQTINALEKNKYCPSTILALKLSNLFGIPVNDIFKLEDSDYWFFLPVNRIKSSPSSCETRPFSIIMLEGIERLKEIYGYLPNLKCFPHSTAVIQAYAIGSIPQSVASSWTVRLFRTLVMAEIRVSDNNGQLRLTGQSDVFHRISRQIGCKLHYSDNFWLKIRQIAL